jgi:hypothetical protein
MTQGDSPSCDSLNGTRGNTKSCHTSQNRENCESKMMDGNDSVIWIFGPQDPKKLKLCCMFLFGENRFMDGFLARFIVKLSHTT